MARLVNGLIFGLGLGVITTAFNGLADGYGLSSYIMGTALILTSGGWALYHKS